MRERAIQDLASLKDSEFFKEVADGLQLTAENARRISDDAHMLAEASRPRGTRILEAFAQEEAAKFLILLDAVRCPRDPQKRFTAHLKKWYSHLAKGLYASYCNRRPHSIAALREWVARDAQLYYLDGPNDVDWIFKNYILQSREDTIYVNFIENDGVHHWQSPQRMDDLVNTPHCALHAVELACALHDVGCAQPQALELIARLWRPFPLSDETHWVRVRDKNIEVLQTLDEASLLNEQPQSVYQYLVDNWCFPMYDLEMREIEVAKSDLDEIRRQWTPEW